MFNLELLYVKLAVNLHDTYYCFNCFYLNRSSPCSVSLVVSSGLSSIGDVLRDIDQKSLFESDFLLVPGDIVSNGQLKEALEEHK